jgi:hypothetical protein
MEAGQYFQQARILPWWQVSIVSKLGFCHGWQVSIFHSFQLTVIFVFHVFLSSYDN